MSLIPSGAAKDRQALTQRARLILACAEGYSNNDVSTQVGPCSQSVGKWRRRFLDRRLAGLSLAESQADAVRLALT